MLGQNDFLYAGEYVVEDPVNADRARKNEREVQRHQRHQHGHHLHLVCGCIVALRHLLHLLHDVAGQVSGQTGQNRDDPDEARVLDGRGIRQIKAEEVEVHREDALAVAEALEDLGCELAGGILECVQLFGDNDLYGVVCAREVVQTDQLRELDNGLAAQADDVLKRLLNRVVQTHHDGERNELGQTAAHRADAAAFIERLDFLVELGAVVCVLLLKLLRSL